MKMISYCQPGENGEDQIVCLSEQEAIKIHRELHPELANERDEDVLEDFMIIHWAFYDE